MYKNLLILISPHDYFLFFVDVLLIVYKYILRNIAFDINLNSIVFHKVSFVGSIIWMRFSSHYQDFYERCKYMLYLEVMKYT